MILRKNKITSVERELDKIRGAFYKKTKHMTSSERTDYVNKSAEEGISKLGYKLVPANDPDVPDAMRLVKIDAAS